MHTLTFHSPLGNLTVYEERGALVRLSFSPSSAVGGEGSPLLWEAKSQVLSYFAGELRQFSLPLAPSGTPFQQSVWSALCTIPYGEIRSYGQIAAQIGNTKASRAVGMANNRNPLPILIPCHRVIGAGGKLVGYAGGLDIKQSLLQLEGTTSWRL